jgi:hypothetical protein
MNTKKNHHPVKPHIPDPPSEAAVAIIDFALAPSQIIPIPDNI